MTKPILVGYDPTETDASAVAFGLVAARFTGAPLIVGSVHADHDRIGHGHHGADADLPEDAMEALASLRDELTAGDVKADVRALKHLSAPRALHEAAEELDAGLLVVGSSSRRTAGRKMHGSTAERLLHG